MIELCFALLGHPVAHSISPQIHAAAFRELGLSHRYVSCDVPDQAALRAQFSRLRAGELAGANVTVPWKRDALALCEAVDPSAADVGAANVIVRDPSAKLWAHNTDVGALLSLLRPLDVAGMALVIGNGGAALAAVAACRRAGLSSVAVVARSFTRAFPRGSWPRAAAFQRLGAEPRFWPDQAPDEWQSLVRRAALIIQTTSAGMSGADPGQALADLVPWRELRRDVICYDVVYNPLVTPFLAAARAEGLRAEGGLSMLIGQAALSLELWLGVEAPRAAMERAAADALGVRS